MEPLLSCLSFIKSEYDYMLIFQRCRVTLESALYRVATYYTMCLIWASTGTQELVLGIKQ